MAKKSKSGKRLNQKAKVIIEKTVFKLYDFGVWQSTIFHTILLLILALTFSSIVEKKKLLPITISFTSVSDSIEPDMSGSVSLVPSVELPQESLNSSSTEIIIEKENIEIDSSTMNNASEIAEAQPYSGITKADLMEKLGPVTESSIDDFPSEFNDDKENTVIESKPKKASIKPKITPKKKQYASSVEKKNNSQQRGILGHGSLLADSNNNVTGVNGSGMSGSQNNGEGDGNGAALNEINRRLIRYGAKTGDVQIALAWNTVDDLDLHVLVKPMNSNINWTTRWGACGGMLDIDMNAHPNFLNNQPIENIFWQVGHAPVGAEYVVGVHLFRSWTGAQQVNAMLAIKIDGNVKTFPVVVQLGNRVIPVTTFKR